MAGKLEIAYFMKAGNYLAIVLFIYGLIGCSVNNDCFIADSVIKVKSIAMDGETYYVYLRISGFNEKEYFYELYRQEPKFDDCGMSNFDPLSDIHVDAEEGRVVAVIIENNRLALRYSIEASSNARLAQVPVEVK